MSVTTTTTPSMGWRADRWTLPRMTIVATLVLPVIAIVAFLGVQILFVPEVGPMLAVFLALAIANVWRANRWLQLSGGLAVFAFGALNAVFIAAELVRPDHYPTFFLGWLAVVCALAGLAAGLAGFVDARRHRLLAPHWAGVGATLLLLAGGFMLGLFTASAATRFVDTGPSANVALTPEAEVLVDVADFSFGDGTITIASGELTRIALTNRDGEAHTFTIDALGIDADVLAGKTTEVWLRVAAPGTYEVYCLPHSSPAENGGREGMRATLVVE